MLKRAREGLGIEKIPSFLLLSKIHSYIHTLKKLPLFEAHATLQNTKR